MGERREVDEAFTSLGLAVLGDFIFSGTTGTFSFAASLVGAVFFAVRTFVIKSLTLCFACFRMRAGGLFCGGLLLYGKRRRSDEA